MSLGRLHQSDGGGGRSGVEEVQLRAGVEGGKVEPRGEIPEAAVRPLVRRQQQRQFRLVQLLENRVLLNFDDASAASTRS